MDNDFRFDQKNFIDLENHKVCEKSFLNLHFM